MWKRLNSSYLKNEKGVALILVLFLVTIVSIMLVSVIFVSYYSSTNSIIGERKLDAKLRAQAGIEDGIQYIINNNGNINLPYEIDLDPSNWYKVSISLNPNNQNQFMITSSANYLGQNRTENIEYKVFLSLSKGIGGLSSNLFNYALAGVNNVDLGVWTNVEISGDVKGNFSPPNLFSSYSINGTQYSPYTETDFLSEIDNIWSQINSTYSFPTNLSGTRHINSDETIIEDITANKVEIDTFAENIQIIGNIYANDFKIQNFAKDITIEGNLYVKNMDIKQFTSNIIIKGNLIVDGKLNLNNFLDNLKVDGLIIAKEIRFNNFITGISAPYIIASDKLTLSNTNDLSNIGGIAAKEIDFGNFNNIIIDNNLFINSSAAGINISNWNYQEN